MTGSGSGSEPGSGSGSESGSASGPGSGSGGGRSPVEDYLDALLRSAPGPAREVRALLAEADAHLHDATDEGIARGLTPLDAEEEAVARFGPVRAVTSAEARRQRLPLAALARQTVASALFLGAVAGIGLGVSGILTAALEAIGGSTFVVDISPSTRLAASDCARWLSQDHGAHSCYQAALSDWSFEVVAYRLLVGVMGVIALAAFFWLRRHWTRRQRFSTLPATVTDTIAVTLFGGAGVWSLGLGIDWAVQSHNGAGQWLGSAPAALVLAAWFGFRLLGDLRAPSYSLGNGAPAAISDR